MDATHRVRITLSVDVHVGSERDAICVALDLVNEDVWRTLEGEGFTVEADARPFNPGEENE